MNIVFVERKGRGNRLGGKGSRQTGSSVTSRKNKCDIQVLVKRNVNRVCDKCRGNG